MTAAGRRRVGVIGDPVAHSISPAMHQPALDALGIPATYELWQTPAAELPARIASLRAPDVLGANVTVPHKQAVMGALDEVSTQARRAGAVNTIINRGGRLLGDNTDIYGFATALAAICPDAEDRTAVILGAGGAARGVALALEQLGVTDIRVVNRNRERAERLAADLAPTMVSVLAPERESDGREERGAEAASAALTEQTRLKPADEAAAQQAILRDVMADTGILINATSLGWHPGEWPLDPDLLRLLPDDAVVMDLTYRDTELLRAARARGLQAVDGLAMLVHQGARALEHWTGAVAPVQIMLDAAERARAARA